jgi:YHS domain-containing protein
MGWLLRLLLILLLVVLVLQAIGRVVQGFFAGVSGQPPQQGRRAKGGVPTRGHAMVRDPVCGTFVVQSRALTAARGGETAWFCSEQCRREWQAERS